MKKGSVVTYRGASYEVKEDLGNKVRLQSGLVLEKSKIKSGGAPFPKRWDFIKPKNCKFRFSPAQEAVFVDPNEYNINPHVLEALTEIKGRVNPNTGIKEFSLFKHQAESYQAIKQQSTLLAFDVSAGKTIAMLLYALEAMLTPDKGGLYQQVIYLSPTKALANNQADNMAPILDMLGISYSVIHGDIRPQDRDYTASMIFTNHHSLDRMLVNPKIDPCDVGVVVMDEVHSLAAGPDGGHLACVLKNLNYIRSNRNPALNPIRYVGLSATIEKPQELFKKVTGQDCIVLTEATPMVAERTVIAKYRDKKRGEEIHTALNLVNNGYGGFIFIDSRKRCEEACHKINNAYGSEIAGYYHSKMDVRHQEENARRFANGDLKIIVTTSSLEAGIDLPGAAQFVMVVCNDIDQSALKQRLGRAGRDGTPCLGYIIVGPGVYSLDAFLDRDCMVVMPADVPPIQEIHARRLAWVLALEGRRDAVKVAAELYPLSEITEVPQKDPFRSERLFDTERNVKLCIAQGNIDLGSVSMSTALASYLPETIVEIYDGNRSTTYEVESLDTDSRLCTLLPSKKIRTYPTPTMLMSLGDHEVYEKLDAMNSTAKLTKGYGNLIDTCKTVTINNKGYVKTCPNCGTENNGYANKCRNCGEVALNKRYRDEKPRAIKIPPVSNNFNGSFTMIETLDEDLGIATGAAYAICRVLTRMLNLKEDEVGVGYSKTRVVFYDRHPHGAATAYLYDNWASVLKETITEVGDCVCTTGCSNCTEKLRGSPLSASSKSDSMYSLQSLQRIKF